MPIFVKAMKHIYVPPPCNQAMDAIPHKEHLALEIDKIGVVQELDPKLVVGILPIGTPRYNNVIKDAKDLVDIVIDGQIHHLVSFSVSHYKLVL